MTGTLVAVLVAYLLVLLAIGWWGSRDAPGLESYYVAGKRLPGWVIAFSSNATGESGWLLLGLTGMGYAVGIHALWVVAGEVLGVALAWTLVAPRFKVFTDRYQAITVPDYLAARFRDESHALRVVSSLVILSMVTAYTAAQLTASGKAFVAFLGTSYTTGVVIGAVVVLYYTTLGGFKAVAYSDVVQGLLMFGGLLALPFVGFHAAGGWTATLSRLEAIDPALLQPMGSHGLSATGIASAVSFLGIGIAFLGAPQLLTRFVSASGPRAIVSGGVIAVVSIIVFDLGAVFGGMAGRALFDGLADPETVLPRMSAGLMSPLAAGAYLVIVLAAIMSTVDSLVILASSAVVRDIVQQILDPAVSDARLAGYGRLTTLAIGGVALAFALGEVRVIFWFVLFAWSGLACAFTPVVLSSLYWPRTTRAGALAGMIVGFATAVSWVLVAKSRFYDLYEMIPGFVLGLVATVGVSLLTRPPEGAAREVAEVAAQTRAWSGRRDDERRG